MPNPGRGCWGEIDYRTYFIMSVNLRELKSLDLTGFENLSGLKLTIMLTSLTLQNQLAQSDGHE